MKLNYLSRFEAKDHPQARDIHLHVKTYFVENWDWESEEEKARYLVEDIEAAGTLTIPDASYERSIIMTTWLTWGFLFDDKFEDMPKNEENRKQAFLFMNLILGTALPDRDSKLQAVTYDVGRSLLAVQDKESQELGHLIQRETVQWFKDVATIGLKSNESLLTFDGIVEHRRKTTGMWIMWPIIRWALALHVPEHLLARPEIRKLEDLVSLYAILSNDIYSYRKELNAAKANNSGMENVMAAIMSEKGLSEEAAISDICKRLHDIEEEFETTERELYKCFEGRELAVLTDYVQGIKNVLGGTMAFGATARRYHNL